MHVSTPGWLITFRLERAGNDAVNVSCPIPLSVPGQPVNEPGDYCSMGARLVSGDRVNRAHSIFRTPRGCAVHTAHSFMQGSHDNHAVIVACQGHLRPGQCGQNLRCPRGLPRQGACQAANKMQGRYSLAARQGVMRGFPRLSAHLLVSAEGCAELIPTPPPTVMEIPRARTVLLRHAPPQTAAPPSRQGHTHTHTHSHPRSPQKQGSTSHWILGRI